MTKHRAKTPEEEVEPLADPEPDDAWPPVKEPHDDEYEPPDKKAAREDETPPPGAVDPGFGVAGLSLEELQKLRDLRAVAQSSFDVSGPHHS